jgi:hypothetical protein
MSSELFQTHPWYLPRRINNIRSKDFTRYGPFAHIKLPLQTPIPEEILEHIFGEDHEELGEKAELKLLLQLHDTLGERELEICKDCENHLVQFNEHHDHDSKVPCM